jgi:hypothetical protein
MMQSHFYSFIELVGKSSDKRSLVRECDGDRNFCYEPMYQNQAVKPLGLLDFCGFKVIIRPLPHALNFF